MIAAKMKQALNDYNGVLYQTHTWEGRELNHGQKGGYHRTFIDPEDIKDKRILDLGCATGADCIWAMENGALEVWGIDCGLKQIQTLSRLANIVGEYYPDIFWCRRDLRVSGVPWDISELPWDTIFCFSILRYVRYLKLWERVPTAKIIYIEEEHDTPFTISSLSNHLYQAELLGKCPARYGGEQLTKPLFKLTRRN